MPEPLLGVVAQLPDHGLRATASRIAVLDVVRALPGHPDADAVRTADASRLGSVSVQAVHVLRTLTDAGLLRRIEPAGSPPGTRPGWATTTTT